MRLLKAENLALWQSIPNPWKFWKKRRVIYKLLVALTVVMEIVIIVAVTEAEAGPIAILTTLLRVVVKPTVNSSSTWGFSTTRRRKNLNSNLRSLAITLIYEKGFRSKPQGKTLRRLDTVFSVIPATHTTSLMSSGDGHCRSLGFPNYLEGEFVEWATADPPHYCAQSKGSTGEDTPASSLGAGTTRGVAITSYKLTWLVNEKSARGHFRRRGRSS